MRILGQVGESPIDQTATELFFWELPYRFFGMDIFSGTYRTLEKTYQTRSFLAFLGPSANVLGASTMSCLSILWAHDFGQVWEISQSE